MLHDFVRDDAPFHEDSGACTDFILDGGATAGLVGAATLSGYVSTLRNLGIDTNSAGHTYDCFQRFRFGDDEVLLARTTSAVSNALQNHMGIMIFYVLPGSTPFLVARPMKEK